MEFIKTFESFEYSIEGLSKLNEDQIDSLFKDSFKNMLGGARITDKTPEQIKGKLQEKLKAIKSQYESSLSEYISDKYDEKWYQPLLDLVTAPGTGFINMIGAKADETEMTKKREAAKDKALAEESKKIVDESPILAVLLKSVVLAALPKGMKLEEGMETKNIKPDSKELAKVMYEASMETASKLFESATSGLNNLSDISFEFETLAAKIEKNNENLDKLREELKALDESDNTNDYIKKIEMYICINTLRAQQCALMAAQAEYEFLTGSVERTWLGSIQGYAQALFEIAFFLISAIVATKLINWLGKMSFVTEIKQYMASVSPTIIPGFQDAVNQAMSQVSRAALPYIGPIVAAYTIFRGSAIQEELEFEQNEKFLLIALEQFIPTISAVNVSLAMCDSASKTFMQKIESLKPEDIFGEAVNATPAERDFHMERVKKYSADLIYNSTLSSFKSDNGPLANAINSMEVSDTIKKSLNADVIFNSPTRGATGIYSWATKLGLELDFLKNIKDIFDKIENPLLPSLEKKLISDDIYTKAINKENPTHAALGGLIFLCQSTAMLENLSPFIPIRQTFPPIEVPNLPKMERTVNIKPLEIRTISEFPDFSEPEVESCGVFVSIVDENQKVYKSRVGMLYFEKGKFILDETKSKNGIDGFSQLLQDYKFNFVIVGNADVSGPQEQRKSGGFIGNRLLSELRANAFFGALKKSGDEKFSVLGCGKMYARNYPEFIKKDSSTAKIADTLGVSRKDETFLKKMADDRRIEVIIFPDNVDFGTFANNDPLIEKVCKKPYNPNDDERLIRMKNGKWFIVKAAETEYNLKFPKRGEKSTNESNRLYVVSFDSFI